MLSRLIKKNDACVLSCLLARSLRYDDPQVRVYARARARANEGTTGEERRTARYPYTLTPLPYKQRADDSRAVNGGLLIKL